LESTWVRGATDLFEKHHQYLKLAKHKLWLLQPRLWEIFSWVAHDLQSSGPEISHSITCSTALHAVLNGGVLIRNG
jgi:3-oxoacyl-(acyl-carrier-protein) synthase